MKEMYAGTECQFPEHFKKRPEQITVEVQHEYFLLMKRMVLHIEGGKGKKARYAPLPTANNRRAIHLLEYPSQSGLAISGNQVRPQVQ